MKSDTLNKMFGLLFWVLLCLGVGAAGSMATVSQISGWYAELNKPSWNPPPYVFGPVWTVLYILMGISVWRIWLRKNELMIMPALSAFLIQLALNGLWSFLFFGLHSPGAAFVDIVLLWAAIILTIRQFWNADRMASYLLAPYFLWVSFASVLNYTVWSLNKG